MSQLVARLEAIFDGASAGPSARWTAANFFDKVLFAQGSIPPHYWPGDGLARPIPGLPVTEVFDGVEVVANHVVLWRGSRFKWSDVNDFTLWIPVAETAASVTATIATIFPHPEAGQTTDWIFLNEQDRAFVVGQFVRVDIAPEDPLLAVYHFYQVADTLDTTGLSTTTIRDSQAVAAGDTERIFVAERKDWPVGARLMVDGDAHNFVVEENCQDLSMTLELTSGSDPVTAVGDTFIIKIDANSNPTGLQPGDVLSIGPLPAVGYDLYEVVDVGYDMRVKRLGIGTNQAPEGFVFAAGWSAIFQPWIDVTNNEADDFVLLSGVAISAQSAVKLTGLGLTGEMTPGNYVPQGYMISSLDANEAGEAVNAGNTINGDIFAIVELGEYGYILKRRSIQVMIPVGRTAGVFNTRLEVADEGPIARHSWCRLFDNGQVSGIAFVGQREIYKYVGGQTLTPIATSHSTQFFDELDRSRADEITLYQNEDDNELWVVYPQLGQLPLRVLVWNYLEDTCVIDDYDEKTGGLTAVGGIEIETAPTWLEAEGTWEEQTKRWFELVDDGLKRRTIIGIAGDDPNSEFGEDIEARIPRLLLHGRVYHRTSSDDCDFEAYQCLAETPDFDFGDSARWKYLSTLQLSLEIKTALQRPMRLFVQFGARDNLDSDIRWTDPDFVEASGNGNFTTKINRRVAGRFVRVRFYSEEVGISWRIASYSLYARVGGTY